MPRPERLRVENGLYHVFTHGVDGRIIFRDDWDYVALMASAEKVHELHGWKVLMFCVLGTHYHYLVQTPQADLPQGMWRINIGYSRWFNKRYGMRGHVFDRRYGARLIANEGHSLEVVRYIALNPCEAGVCRRPEDWSSNSGAWSGAPISRRASTRASTRPSSSSSPRCATVCWMTRRPTRTLRTKHQ